MPLCHCFSHSLVFTFASADPTHDIKQYFTERKPIVSRSAYDQAVDRFRKNGSFGHVRADLFGDDVLLYAQSLGELEDMLGLLDDELASVGLELHEGKTKIITSDLSNSISFVEISSELIEVLRPQKSHKYLGKYLIADASRNQVELQYCIQIAWHAFHEHRLWLLNRNVPAQLRVRLFSFVNTPSVLFGSSVFR